MCGAKIGVQHFFAEVVTGLIVAGVPFFLNAFFKIQNISFFSLQEPFWYYTLVILWVLVFFVWLLMVLVDFRLYIIPNELNVILLVFGICLTALLFAYGGLLPPYTDSFLRHYTLVFSPFGSDPIMNHLFGFAVAGAFFSLLYFVSRGRGMGMGDVKLAFVLGLLLGWPDVGLAVLLSFIAGGLVSFVLYLLREKGMKDKVPFAPFIVFGSVLAVLCGFSLVNGYFGLFSM